MNIQNSKIIPVSEARAKLSNLLDQAKNNQYFLLTRGGKVKAALVDINYLEKLQKDLSRLYGKTYIDPKLLPLTREFSDEEIAQWLKDDQL